MSAESSVNIRIARLSDVGFVSAAEEKYIDCPWTCDQILEQIQNPSVLFLIAEYNGTPIGYISATVVAGECEIANIAVNAEHRRNGIGNMLITELVGMARERGADTAFLLVRDDNTPAIGLYGKCGFKVVGERPRYYKGKDALIMRLNL